MGNVEANRQLAYKTVETWSIDVGGDVEPFFNLFHDDATFTTMARKDMFPLLAGTLNKKGFCDWVYKETRVTATKLKAEGITADENRLALEASSDMVVNGHSYKNNYHWLFEIRDGKISARFYLDTLFAKKAVEWVEEAEAATKANK
ncbi:uncharacterized protein Z518_07838 [Rhinocladiella mackenziei CBS 650.93]|uniref:Rhinocladiella mackenziei CBS 650.93 unplaced genomic scaffold supercont1.6, whole genome shotgun sequence n=1 Tax=Rhinocladiella mackenziei CBS 650.93 TaxID=1442369 RepID=A0A0D2I7S2_9EURO|nr:uncharacterized protein Z518_07838 [Rhinocladiella mackenziei CBS 650.93]KIX01899.1 hypothetical protein Z518_07838 [Rhinocladiella mackenziei CBS 650.93]